MHEDRSPKLIKTVREEASRISLKKIMQLDRSDRILIEQMLKDIANRMIRVQEIANARCSCVLELYEHMGGHVRTVE